MIRMITQRLEKAHSRVLRAFSGSVDPSVGKVSAVALSVMLLVSLVAVGGAMAQTQQSDDFEDGNTDGWETDAGGSLAISEQSVEGQYSLFVESEDVTGDRPVAEWVAGPTLNMQSEFSVSGVVRVNGDDQETTRIGMSGEAQNEEGENAYLIFDTPNNRTFLHTYTSPSPDGGDAIQDAFNNDWVRFRLESDGGGTLRAKVWEHGTSEPSQWQLERSGLEGIGGNFTLNPGFSGGADNRQIWLDEVALEGQAVTDSEDLELETQRYLPHGGSSDYVVRANISGEWTDVTSVSTVTSNDTDVVTVDESTQTINATDNVSINNRTTVTAEYQGLTATTNVTVANATLDNAKILPGTWRATAMISDDTIFFLIIVAMIMGVIGRYATAFAGLGMGQLAVAIGWWGGYVPEGVAMVSVFLVLFIGFNVAVNVDYTVQR